MRRRKVFWQRLCSEVDPLRWGEQCARVDASSSWMQSHELGGCLGDVGSLTRGRQVVTRVWKSASATRVMLHTTGNKTGKQLLFSYNKQKVHQSQGSPWSLDQSHQNVVSFGSAKSGCCKYKCVTLPCKKMWEHFSDTSFMLLDRC